MENNIFLKTNNIFKKYGENTVLNNICIEIKKGEVHTLVGENGAGKTTPRNILPVLFLMSMRAAGRNFFQILMILPITKVLPWVFTEKHVLGFGIIR